MDIIKKIEARISALMHSPLAVELLTEAKAEIAKLRADIQNLITKKGTK